MRKAYLINSAEGIGGKKGVSADVEGARGDLILHPEAINPSIDGAPGQMGKAIILAKGDFETWYYVNIAAENQPSMR